MRIAVEENHAQTAKVACIGRNNRRTGPKEAQEQVHRPKGQAEDQGEYKRETSAESYAELPEGTPRAARFVANEGGMREVRVEHGGRVVARNDALS